MSSVKVSVEKAPDELTTPYRVKNSLFAIMSGGCNDCQSMPHHEEYLRKFAALNDRPPSSTKKPEPSSKKKGVRVELPFKTTKGSLWDNLGPLYYVEGQENEPLDFSTIFPKRKSSEKRKLPNSTRRTPSTLNQAIKSKKSLRFSTHTSSAIRKRPELTPRPRPRMPPHKNTTNEEAKESVSNDLEHLKTLQKSMIDTLDAIEKKMSSDKENINTKVDKSKNNNWRTMKEQKRTPMKLASLNDSVAAFEMHEELFKTPAKPTTRDTSLSGRMLTFKATMQEFIEHLEKSLLVSEGDESVAGTPTQQPAAEGRTPLTSKAVMRVNSSVSQRYQELKRSIPVLATPILAGGGGSHRTMRLNKHHNLEISRNIVDQLTSLDIH